MTGMPTYNLAHRPGPVEPMEIPFDVTKLSRDELIGAVTQLLDELDAASVHVPDDGKRVRIQNMTVEMRREGFIEPLLSNDER